MGWGEGGARENQDRAQGQHEDRAVLWVGHRDSRSHLWANQPFSWLMRCCLAVHMENLSLWLFGCKLQGLVGVGGNNVCMCATLECKQADVPLVVPAFSSFFPLLAFALPFASFLAYYATVTEAELSFPLQWRQECDQLMLQLTLSCST